MAWMNEYEIESAMDRFDEEEQANLLRGARVLYRLMRWTDSHSDGWAYWPKPARAATRLMNLLQAGEERDRRGDSTDATEADLKAALRPIKAFLTRQGESHSVAIYWED